jgi:hypothetical protein
MTGIAPGPDGMGADRHREREHMKAMRQETRTPPWELAAFDEDGNFLYATEHFESKEAAQSDADAFADGSAYWTDNVPDEVAYFEPRRTE